MKTAASILALIVATTVQASAQPAEVRATGEHRPTVGDTADSARRLALVDARGNTLRAVVTRLQTRADVKNLRLTPSQLEAFAAVIVEVEAEPGPAAPAGGRTPVQVRARTRLDAADVVRRMAGLQKDQDASYQVTAAWAQIRQLHEQLARQTGQRTNASAEAAAAIVQEQLRTMTTLDAKLLAARAVAALARTEPTTVGGRTPSEEGRGQARKLAEAALALAPDLADAHTAMGDLLVDARQPEPAETEFRKALEADPSSSLVRTKLAEAVRLQGRFAESVRQLREAIQRDPSFARAHSDLGLVLRVQGNVEEAVAAYREAIRLDRDWIDAHNGLAVALATSGRLDEALTEFREIIRIDPDSAIGYYNLAFALAEADRDVESAAALREVIRINPNHYNARFNLGELFRLEGKYDDAATQFREYVRLAPDTPQNQGNLERARGYIQRFED
jgi:tetratricopeptide (TPR) repeat protein